MRWRRSEGILWDFGGLMNGGEGPAWGSRILRKQKGAGARAEEAGTAPCSPSQPGGRADGAPFGAGWEAGSSLLVLLLSASSGRLGRAEGEGEAEEGRRVWAWERNGRARVKMPGSRGGLTPAPSLQPSSAGEHGGPPSENVSTPDTLGVLTVHQAPSTSRPLTLREKILLSFC